MITDEYRYLSDGRPINESARRNLIARIKDIGVTGQAMDELLIVFDSSENEARTALNIGSVTWDKVTREHLHTLIPDAGIRILVRRYLENPETWPVKYTPMVDVGYIFDRFKENGRKPGKAPLLCGRAAASIYRWRERPPNDHIKILMSQLETSLRKMEDPDTEQEGLKELEDYTAIVEEEARQCGMNLDTDKKWPSSDDE